MKFNIYAKVFSIKGYAKELLSVATHIYI